MTACSPEVENMDDVLANVDKLNSGVGKIPVVIPTTPPCSFNRGDSIYITVDTNLTFVPPPQSYFNVDRGYNYFNSYLITSYNNSNKIDLEFYNNNGTGLFPIPGVYIVHGNVSAVSKSTGGVKLSGIFGGSSSNYNMTGVNDGRIYVKATADNDVREVIFCNVKMRWNYLSGKSCGLTMNGSAFIEH